MPRPKSARRASVLLHSRFIAIAALTAMAAAAALFAVGMTGGWRLLGQLTDCRTSPPPHPLNINNFDGGGLTVSVNTSCAGRIIVRQEGELSFVLTPGDPSRRTANGIEVSRFQDNFLLSAVGALRNAEITVGVYSSSGGVDRPIRFRFRPPVLLNGSFPATMAAGDSVEFSLERNSIAVLDDNGEWVRLFGEGDTAQGLEMVFRNGRPFFVVNANAAPGPRQIRVNGEERTLTVYSPCRLRHDGTVLRTEPTLLDFDGSGLVIDNSDTCQNAVTVSQDGESVLNRGGSMTTRNGIRVDRFSDDRFEIQAVGALRNEEVVVSLLDDENRRHRFKFRFAPPPPPVGIPPAEMALGGQAEMDIGGSTSFALRLANGSWRRITRSENNMNGLDFVLDNTRLQITVRPDAAPGERRVRVNGVERPVTILPPPCQLTLRYADGQVFALDEVNEFAGTGVRVVMDGDCGAITAEQAGRVPSPEITLDRPYRSPNGIRISKQLNSFAVNDAGAEAGQEVWVSVTSPFRQPQRVLFRFAPPDRPEFPESMARGESSEVEIGENSIAILRADGTFHRFVEDEQNVEGLDVRFVDGRIRVTVRQDAPLGGQTLRINGVWRTLTVVPAPQAPVVGGVPLDGAVDNVVRGGPCQLGPNNPRCVALVIHQGQQPLCTRDARYNAGADTASVRQRFFEQTPEASMNACRVAPEFRAAEAEADRPRNGAPPPPACIRAGEPCTADGPHCCNPGVLQCARRAGAGQNGGTFCLGGADQQLGGGFVNGRLTAGSPCGNGAECGAGQTDIWRLICPAGPMPTCCLNAPTGGDTCWDYPGPMQMWLTEKRLSELTSSVQYCQSYRASVIIQNTQVNAYCVSLLQTYSFLQQTMAKLMGQ